MFESRKYQERAAVWLSTKSRGIIQIPAGGGKSRVAAMALNIVITKKTRTEKVKIGWMSPTIEARDQGLFAMNQFPAVASQDILCVCAASDADMSDRDILVVDECKHSCSETWFKMVSQCKNRWGLDATPFSEDSEKNEKLLELFGGNILEIPREELKDSLTGAQVIILNSTDSNLESRIDAQANAAINRRKHFWKGEEWELAAQCKWQACMDIGIVGNVARNDAIVCTAIQHSNNHVLILVNKIEHGEMLQNQIPGSHLCFSKMGRKLRSETLAAFKSGEIRCILATSLADEAMDVPIADVLIMACGGRSENKAIQRTGRVLRKYDGKDSAKIFDFCDTFHPMSHNHFKKRLSVYRKLKYNIEPL